MGVAIAPQGWVGAWGAEVTSLLRHHPQVAWQPWPEERLAWDVGRGPVAIGGDAWVETSATALVLGRHPFGRLTLYWCRQGGAIWFATRWQWLLPLVAKPTLDPVAVYGYACFSYVPTPLTPYQEIRAAENHPSPQPQPGVGGASRHPGRERWFFAGLGGQRFLRSRKFWLRPNSVAAIFPSCSTATI